MNAKIEMVVRLLLALALLVFGADKFFHFMPVPDPPEEGGKFLGALMDAGYVFPIIGGVFIVSALCLATRRVILGLMLVAPILVNIVAYHVRYDMPGIGGGAVLSALAVILFMLHAGNLNALFRANPIGRKH